MGKKYRDALNEGMVKCLEKDIEELEKKCHYSFYKGLMIGGVLSLILWAIIFWLI